MSEVLRDKIANVMAIIDGDTDKPIVKERVVRYALTDQILSLIEAERCVWHGVMVDKSFYYQTACGHQIAFYMTEEEKYCPFCGKKIEVKDE